MDIWYIWYTVYNNKKIYLHQKIIYHNFLALLGMFLHKRLMFILFYEGLKKYHSLYNKKLLLKSTEFIFFLIYVPFSHYPGTIYPFISLNINIHTPSLQLSHIRTPFLSSKSLENQVWNPFSGTKQKHKQGQGSWAVHTDLTAECCRSLADEGICPRQGLGPTEFNHHWLIRFIWLARAQRQFPAKGIKGFTSAR